MKKLFVIVLTVLTLTAWCQNSTALVDSPATSCRITAEYKQSLKVSNQPMVVTTFRYFERGQALRLENISQGSPKDVQIWNPFSKSKTLINHETKSKDGESISQALSPPVNPRPMLLPSDYGLRIEGLPLTEYLSKYPEIVQMGNNTELPVKPGNPLKGTVVHLGGTISGEKVEIWVDTTHQLIICLVKDNGYRILETKLLEAKQFSAEDGSKVWLPTKGSHQLISTDKADNFSVSATTEISSYKLERPTASLEEDSIFEITPSKYDYFADRSGERPKTEQPISFHGIVLTLAVFAVVAYATFFIIKKR